MTRSMHSSITVPAISGSLRAATDPERMVWKSGCWLWLNLILVEAQLLLSSSCSGAYACSSLESDALLSLKGNDPNDTLLSWKGGSDCCKSWAGVTCDVSTTNVIAVNLTGNLSFGGGFLSSKLCSLSSLQTFTISSPPDSSFHGVIPNCLWNMTTLRFLALERLNLSGSFSSKVCNLKQVQTLSLPGNFLTGHLPPCVWNLTKLKYLDMANSNSGPFHASAAFAHSYVLDLSHKNTEYSPAVTVESP